VEAIKLLESPLRERCDQVWVVTCRPEDAADRLAERGMPKDEADRRMASQMPAEAMAAAADVVIDGSVPLSETRRDVERALAALIEAE
jgi:dephospho-CoA kinase